MHNRQMALSIILTTAFLAIIHSATPAQMIDRSQTRNETDLNDIRQYIIDNPANWEEDENNPQILIEECSK